MWKARTKDGKEISELNAKWGDIENNISELLLVTNKNQVIFLPKGMKSYTQFKTASCDLGSNNVQIESRTIGFSLGNNIIKVRVNEKTNNINIEVEESQKQE